MSKTLANVFIYGTVLVVAALIVTVDLSLVLIVGITTTVILASAAGLSFSIRAKSKKAINSGDPQTNYETDISEEQRPISPVLEQALRELLQLGFQRLGETAICNAAGKELGVEWKLINADRHVIAGLVPVQMHWKGLLGGFETIYPDHAWLITMYPTESPRHETINDSFFRQHHVNSSLEDAYKHHLQQVDDFARQHGEPLTFDTMADYLAMSPIFRERYITRSLRREVLFNQLSGILPAVLAIISLLATIFGSLAPAIALAVFVLCFAVYFTFLSYTIPVRPRIGTIFRLVVGGSLIVLIPVITWWSWIAVLHIGMLGAMIWFLVRFIPDNARVLSNAIEKGETEIDWQGINR
jgi:hypothetical protein